MQRPSHKSIPLRGRGIRRALVAGALSALLIASGCTFGGPGAPSGSPATGAVKPTRQDATETTPTIPLAGKVLPPKSGAYLGVYTPPAPFRPAAINAFESATGKDVSIVMWYQPWAATNRSAFDAGAVVAVWRAGKVPMITWEPWDPGSDANQLTRPGTQPRYRLSRIIKGEFDPYIRSWARQIREVGGPIMLRPMHEMNGDWYPWCGTANGNRPEEYVAAWKHLRAIFAEEGATNVTWVWSINHESVPGTPANRFAAYYPGDSLVDWTAVSGFNFGTTSPYSSWRDYTHWYAPALTYLRTLPKPICIAEFATVEQGGDKAVWITDAYGRVRRDPSIKAIIYYDAIEKGPKYTQDWRVGTSARSRAAFRAAIAPPHFSGATPPVLTSWVDTLKPPEWQFLIALEPVY
jgi:hypothetical protein